MNKSSTNKDAIPAITLLFLLLFLAFQNQFFIYLAIAFILISFLWKGFSEAANFIWQKLGEAVGKVTGTVILTLIFFVVVFPMSLGMKLLGKDPMKLKQPRGNSNFDLLERKIIKADLQNPY